MKTVKAHGKKLFAHIKLLFLKNIDTAWKANTHMWVDLWDELKLTRKGRRFKSICRKAQLRANAEGRTYYVLKDSNGNPYEANGSEINLLKKMGVYRNRFDISDVLKEAMFIAYPNPKLNKKKR